MPVRNVFLLIYLILEDTPRLGVPGWMREKKSGCVHFSKLLTRWVVLAV